VTGFPERQFSRALAGMSGLQGQPGGHHRPDSFQGPRTIRFLAEGLGEVKPRAASTPQGQVQLFVGGGR